MAFLEEVPFLDGKYLTYRGYFALLAFLIAIAISFVFFGCSKAFVFFSCLEPRRRRIALKRMEKKIVFSDKDAQLRRMFELARLDLSQDEVRKKAAISFVKMAQDHIEVEEKQRSGGFDGIKEGQPKDYFEFPQIPEVTKFQSRLAFTLTLVYLTLEVLAYSFLTFGITSLGAFDYLSIYFTDFLNFSLFFYKFGISMAYLSSCYYYDPLRVKKYRIVGFMARLGAFIDANFRKVKVGMKENVYCSFFLALLFLFIPSFYSLFFRGSCVCNFYGSYSIDFSSMGANSALTTKVLRSWGIPTICPEGPPTHVYATVPETAATDVFINFHVNSKVKEATVFYEYHSVYLDKGYMSKSKEATLGIPIWGLDSTGQRSVFSALISELQPGTFYDLSIFYDGKNQSNHSYKSISEMPSDISPMVFLSGGDLGNYEIAWNVSKRAAETIPDLIVFG